MHPVIENINTGNVNNDFIFKILIGQTRNRLEEHNLGPQPYEYEEYAQMIYDSLAHEGKMCFKDAILPDVRWYYDWHMFPKLYADSIAMYHLFDSKYTIENIKWLEDLGCEGSYELNNVKINKGDNVIDAGAYIGDWSIVAKAEGANVYAFEPSDNHYQILQQAAELNGFETIKCGLGDIDGVQAFDNTLGYVAHRFLPNGNIQANVMKLDTFAKNKDIKIDFIKADIEGYEAELLRGAKEVLKNDEPKLAFRTYHKPMDMYELPALIEAINPKYEIVHRHVTLYAEVPR